MRVLREALGSEGLRRLAAGLALVPIALGTVGCAPTADGGGADAVNRIETAVASAARTAGADYLESAVVVSSSGIPATRTVAVALHLAEQPDDAVLAEVVDGALGASWVESEPSADDVRLYVVLGANQHPNGGIDANEQNRIDLTAAAAVLGLESQLVDAEQLRLDADRLAERYGARE